MVHGPPHFGTDPTFGQQDIPKIEEEVLDSREKCEAKGGFWDEEKRKCLLVKKEDLPKEEEPPKVDPDVPEVGEIIGSSLQTVTLPDGRKFVGLNKEEVEQLVRGEAEQKARLAGTEPAGTAQARIEEQFRLKQSLSRLGKVDPATLQLENIQQADIDWGQAITAGTIGSAPSIIGAAATGAIAGAFAGAQVGAIGGPAGAIALGVIGAAVGVWRGIQSNIKEQQKGEIGATSADLQAGQLKMRQYAMAASRDPYHVDYYIQLYNNEKANLYRSERQLKTEVTGNLNKWMDDGRVQLAKFEDFLEEDGIADIYENKLRISLQMGVPLMPEDFGEIQ